MYIVPALEGSMHRLGTQGVSLGSQWFAWEVGEKLKAKPRYFLFPSALMDFSLVTMRKQNIENIMKSGE